MQITIRRAGRDDVPAVLALLDGATEWLVARGRTDQWGTEPHSTNPRRIAQITEFADDGLWVAETDSPAVAPDDRVDEPAGRADRPDDPASRTDDRVDELAGRADRPDDLAAKTDGRVEGADSRFAERSGRADEMDDRFVERSGRVDEVDDVVVGTGEVVRAGRRVVGALAVGAAMPYVPPATEPELYVRLLVTERASAGQGIGRDLLDHARMLAREAGVGLIRVDCFAGGDGALVRYYEKRGFSRDAEFAVSVNGSDWPGQVLSQRL